MHILHVVGARPNFVKLAPVFAALTRRNGVRQTLVHTGQHYDPNMSEMFFHQLKIPQADVNLEVGSNSHAIQTAEIMLRIEPVLLSQRPDLVLVYGDVNSTVAAALVCAKLLIPVGHVEAGLRSYDRKMPEEINRVITDQISSLLFTPSSDANENLRKEGIDANRIYFVGNVMIDSLVRLLPAATKPEDFQIPSSYALVTLHRPSNVDDSDWLKRLVAELEEVSRELPVIFPMHPRTRERIALISKRSHSNGMCLCDARPYLEFLYLEKNAKAVITDSGGIQEETTFLGVPCLTMRENTERPVTVDLGTNIIVGRDLERMRLELQHVLHGETKKGSIPPLWDAHAAERIEGIICGRTEGMDS